MKIYWHYSVKQWLTLVDIDYIFREDILIIDMLVRHHCMREEDMGNLLKFDKKLIRAKIAGLKKDKLIQEKPRMESRADDPTKVEKMNCYFINYKIFVNVVKYKLNHMLKKVKKLEPTKKMHPLWNKYHRNGVLWMKKSHF